MSGNPIVLPASHAAILRRVRNFALFLIGSVRSGSLGVEPSLWPTDDRIIIFCGVVQFNRAATGGGGAGSPRVSGDAVRGDPPAHRPGVRQR